MVEEHSYYGLERRCCRCEHFPISPSVSAVDHAISGPRLDHRCTILRCQPESMPLIILGDNLHRYVILVAVLGFLVYNTSAIYPFYPFVPVPWKQPLLRACSMIPSDSDEPDTPFEIKAVRG